MYRFITEASRATAAIDALSLLQGHRNWKDPPCIGTWRDRERRLPQLSVLGGKRERVRERKRERERDTERKSERERERDRDKKERERES